MSLNLKHHSLSRDRSTFVPSSYQTLQSLSLIWMLTQSLFSRSCAQLTGRGRPLRPDLVCSKRAGLVYALRRAVARTVSAIQYLLRRSIWHPAQPHRTRLVFAHTGQDGLKFATGYLAAGFPDATCCIDF
ncbi:hypothetical protein PENSPDRAFT_203920 [Peniophora sp. CONT]|nr:hypothetical protein PENSPDRAFT_203920 [Peniophora sp. CONT]